MAQSSVTPSPSSAEAWLRALVAAVGLAGVACIVGAVLSAGGHTAAPTAHLLLAVALICAGDLAVLHVRYRGERHVYLWSEAAVVFALALVPHPWVCICAAVAVTFADGIKGRAATKIVFNAATMAVATSAALVSMHLYGDPAALHGAVMWPAFATAAAISFLVSSLFVSAAVAFSQGVSVGDVLTSRLNIKLIVFAANTAAAVTIVALHWRPAMLGTIAVSFAVLYAGHRAYLRVKDDRDTWRLLEHASKDLVGLHAGELAARVLDHVTALTQASRAELFVHRPDERFDHYTRSPDQLHHGIVDVTAIAAMDLSAPLTTTMTHWAQSGERTPYSVTVRLETAELIGVLRLAFSGGSRLGKRDRQFLMTFTRSVALNLNNALLFEGMEEAARRLEYDATHDQLTGMPNRTALMRRAADLLADQPCALLLVDLDHFKTINDTLGHSTGDRLLVTTAERLAAAAPQGAIVARLGGDEFAVFVAGLSELSAADAIAETLIADLARPVSLDGIRLSIDASVGISSYPTDAHDVGEMLAHADIALYRAKAVRSSHRRYRADHDDSSVARLSLAADLQSALRNDELVVHYQPQYRLRDSSVAGAEALVRWQHPTRGLLHPDDFISVAEESGLAHDFTKHVLAMAVRDACKWQRPDAPMHVAVNLSARNLLDPDLPGAVAEVLATHGLEPSLLVLEITETTMLSELETIEETLAVLRAIGVQISVDDFGTGYSSLWFLARNSVNELKVDRSFVQRMLASDTDGAIVRATIELGHGLGLRVVAEGVEDPATLAALGSLGCDHAQGYLMSRPMPARSFVAAIAKPSVVQLHAPQQREAQPRRIPDVVIDVS
jgi:diguanylate cyclase (GGDEF)-like protein